MNPHSLATAAFAACVFASSCASSARCSATTSAMPGHASHGWQRKCFERAKGSSHADAPPACANAVWSMGFVYASDSADGSCDHVRRWPVSDHCERTLTGDDMHTCGGCSLTHQPLSPLPAVQVVGHPADHHVWVVGLRSDACVCVMTAPHQLNHLTPSDALYTSEKR